MLGGKFVAAAAFPQEIGVDLRRFFLGALEKISHIAVKLGKDVGGFDFGALAVLGLRLIGGVGLLDNGGGFEFAAFFVKNIHGAGAGRWQKGSDYSEEAPPPPKNCLRKVKPSQRGARQPENWN